MKIYLDHAATTYTRPEVFKAMHPYFSDIFGNPGSLHSHGLQASKIVSESRKKIAKILNCQAEEIIFTGSGTESINLAIKGLANSLKNKGKHIITSSTEHHAVIETCEFLKGEGFEITYLDVDEFGLVKPEILERAIRKDTILISIMYANNEVGSINPISELGKIAKKHNILFHTDACQAAGLLDINVDHLNVDLMSLNGSKIYATKGIGILYKKRSVNISPLIHGGGQEFGLRSGTENVPFIVGLTKALELAQKEKKKESARLTKLRDRLISGIIKKIPKTFLNGHPKSRLPNNVNVTILDVEGESVLLLLNEKGISASTGSACTSKDLEPSHVLTAMGLPHAASHGSIRFTLGLKTKQADIDYVLKVLPGIVDHLRKISPVKLSMGEMKHGK